MLSREIKYIIGIYTVAIVLLLMMLMGLIFFMIPLIYASMTVGSFVLKGSAFVIGLCGIIAMAKICVYRVRLVVYNKIRESHSNKGNC